MVANESIKNFPTLYKFCNGDLNKFFLLLRKGYILLMKGYILLMNIWIAEKDLMKIQYHSKTLFTAN